MVVTEISRKCFLSRKKRFEVQTNNFETQVSKKNIFYVWYRKNGSLRKKKIGPATTYYCYRNNLLVEKKVLDENKLSEKTIFQYDKQGLLRKTITISEKTNTITRKTVNYEFYSR